MAMLGKTTAVAAFILAAAASAYPVCAQIAAAPPGSVVLPYVTIQGQGGSNPGHYQVPAGYDSDVTLHPYTSGLGPCTEGAQPSQGCRHPTGRPIPPSHYEQPPFTR